jgi:hypothetical protein
VKESVYLSGVWQSEKYFRDYEKNIRKEITLKNAPSPEFERMKRQITQNQSVSIHVRRGDYVTKAKTNSLHGTCSPEYYRLAIKEISNNLTSPTFFIFTDDVTWTKENLQIKQNNIYVSGNKFSNAEELILMSMCQHNIIANSTFSWWAAWLNTNPHKVVIAPKQWFATSTIDTKDLIPPNWKTL